MTDKARNSRTHCHRAVPVWTNVGRVTAYWEIAANLVYSMFSMYMYLIVKLAFSHLSFWIGIYFVSDCATSYINALGLAISEKIFLLFLFKAIGTNDPRDRAFFTPGLEWPNLRSPFHNIAEYKTYKIWFLVVSVVSEKMIFPIIRDVACMNPRSTVHMIYNEYYYT